MNLEKALEELDSWVVFSNPENKDVKFKKGLCVRYSINKQKWVCGYGLRGANEKHFGFGDTPLEAVLNKLSKLDN